MIPQSPIIIYRLGWPQDNPEAMIALAVPCDEEGECYHVDVIDPRYQQFINHNFPQLLEKAKADEKRDET